MEPLSDTVRDPIAVIHRSICSLGLNLRRARRMLASVGDERPRRTNEGHCGGFAMNTSIACRWRGRRPAAPRE